jgi:hypothetical protein
MQQVLKFIVSTLNSKTYLMKKIVPNRGTIILSVLFGLMTSFLSAQSFMTIKGVGPSKTKVFNVSGFHGIDVSNGFDVDLVQGNSEGLTLTVQENLLEFITVKVDQGILKIYSDKNINATEPLKARITFKDINKLNVSGGGDVSSETPVKVQKMDIGMSGGGDITFNLTADELKCGISGGGDLRVDGNIKNYNLDLTGGGDVTSVINSAAVIDCRVSGGGDVKITSRGNTSDAKINISGGGDLAMELNAEKLKCSLSGGGDATLSGQAGNVDISLNGGGDLNARDLQSGIIAFQVSGGSDIHVSVSKELTGQISGGGNVYYTGNPAKVTVDTRGGSMVKKEN